MDNRALEFHKTLTKALKRIEKLRKKLNKER
jgi:hypothetical protein